MTCGSKLLENFIPQEDAVHVSRLKKAGAIMLGKTNTSEFGLKTLTDNLLFGITRNPWNLERTSGGSSGGAAAAVAAGLGPLAVGMDAGGSIRIPSSCCGVFGIKPQLGRIPRCPGLYVAELLNHDGPISRTVRDAALMLDVASGLHWGDIYSIPAPATKFSESLNGGVKGLRIAWSPDLGYANVDAQVAAICERAARQFSDIGAVLDEAGPGFEYPQDHFNNLFRADIAAAFSRFGPVDQIVSQVDFVTGAILSAAHEVTATDYARAMFARQDLAITVGRFFQDYDLLLTPTIVEPPPYAEPADPLTFLKLLALTSPFNMTGQPAASVPAGWTDDGLPVGLQIVGRPYDEATVLRAAAAFEEACPWAHRKPAMEQAQS
jgi:aspartyl-tRNA(Asn)/glutamyl-tRNA(Gln) amidotransferase subunit A